MTATYRSRSFLNPDEARAKEWARDTAARLQLGLQNNMRATHDRHRQAEYIAELRDRGRTPHHVAEVARVIAGAVDHGADDMKAPDFVSADPLVPARP
jgi:hypothetical protein